MGHDDGDAGRRRRARRAAIPERWLTRYRVTVLGFAAGALLASALLRHARRGSAFVACAIGAAAVLVFCR